MEKQIRTVFGLLKSLPDYNKCEIDDLAQALQKDLQKQFNMSFETIVGLNDFATKTRYMGDLNCKVKVVFIAHYNILTLVY